MLLCVQDNLKLGKRGRNKVVMFVSNEASFTTTGLEFVESIIVRRYGTKIAFKNLFCLCGSLSIASFQLVT